MKNFINDLNKKLAAIIGLSLALMTPHTNAATFYQSDEGLLVIEAEHFNDNQVPGSHSWSDVADASASGAVAMSAGP
ncbi:MAG: hypothetical protein MJA28_11020, partial [Gammaproteobacteria bacterium]|nr:hypothetical protein [Gammaproteobacteria bacterium]